MAQLALVFESTKNVADKEVPLNEEVQNEVIHLMVEALLTVHKAKKRKKTNEFYNESQDQ